MYIQPFRFRIFPISQWNCKVIPPLCQLGKSSVNTLKLPIFPNFKNTLFFCSIKGQLFHDGDPYHSTSMEWFRYARDLHHERVKGYLRLRLKVTKPLFYHEVAFDVSNDFFIWRKNVSLSRYLDCVFVKSTNFKIRDVIISIAE